MKIPANSLLIIGILVRFVFLGIGHI